MDNILLSAFACDPTKGSEPSNGWNWSVGLSNLDYNVICLTRSVNKSGIESFEVPANLKFCYIKLPYGLEKLYHLSTPGMYIYYLLWQWLAYRQAKRMSKEHQFKLAHHVTWGSTQMGSFLYKLGIPFLFGPAGGGQEAPEMFRNYFGSSWSSEMKRSRISGLLAKYNPGFNKMVKAARVVIASNHETEKLVKENGADRVAMFLDAALSENFYPKTFVPKQIDEEIKLLWVGRFMPRKGLLLVLDVMKELKGYRNISLTVVGDGEIKQEFLNRIEEYDLKATVTWVGKVGYNEVREFYRSHHVFFFTSFRDSCPAQLIEAMAFGMPIVTLDIHGQSLIVNEKTGFKCMADDPRKLINDLKESILKFQEDKSLITEMSNHAYAFAIKQTWRKKISDIVSKYYS